MHEQFMQFRKYLPYAAPVVSLIALMWFLNVTNPLQAGPAGILGVFALAYAFVSTLFYALLTLFLIMMGYFVQVGVWPKKKLYYVASVLAFAPVFLLALNSIGQLDLKDFVLVFTLVAVACFYIVRRS